MFNGEQLGEESKKTKTNNHETRSKSSRRPIAEAASGWSNDIDIEEDSGDTANMPSTQPPIIRQSSRRAAAEEIITTDIPTISMAEVDDTVDMTPQLAVAPQFSVYQIASFKQIEDEFSRQYASQYIDSKIDMGILYNNLHLQEELNAEDKKSWDWEKLFIEVRNSITNPTIDS